MLVLDDLNPLFGAIDACPDGSILLCRESHPQGIRDLRESFDLVYWGGTEPAFFERDGPLGGFRLPVNDGMFAAGRDALVALDSEMRALPGAREWVDERGDVGWRNQFAFNVALARLGVAVELDPTWNLQLHVHDVEADADAARPVAHWRGRRVRILHFGGFGKGKLGTFRQQMRAVADPVVGQGSGRGYDTFLGALRAWTGRRGLNALAWSFHGTADGASALVHDPAVFPPLAVLHHLALANGCTRVLETGTCQGISAGCLASAVAHRPGGGVVSFDPSPRPECRQFWSLLPEGMARCIEQRQVDGVAGMRAALERGEVFHLALLDSIHSAEQVWAEWGLASRLVVEGGLVLIHDATWAGGTVEAALTRIEAEGYGVTRLWTATDGVPEDDRLGLAVIENRRRRTPDDPAPAWRGETPVEAIGGLGKSADGQACPGVPARRAPGKPGST